MKFNAFEGARRILHLTMGAWAIGVGLFTYNMDTSPSMAFNIDNPEQNTPVYSGDRNCGEGRFDALGFLSREFAEDKKVIGS